MWCNESVAADCPLSDIIFPLLYDSIELVAYDSTLVRGCQMAATSRACSLRPLRRNQGAVCKPKLRFA